MPEILTNVARSGSSHLILAHGAGAAMTSPFLAIMAEAIAERGVTVHRFEFAYMAARRGSGTRAPPSKADVLIGEYKEVIAAVRAKAARNTRLFIGGKSLGGRMASLIADECLAAGHCVGLVCLGYPFHPIGKPESLRTAHLEDLKCPTLIVQGERDPFGTRDDVASYKLSKAVKIAWLTDGDHDFKPRVSSGATHEQNLASAAGTVVQFIKKC